MYLFLIYTDSAFDAWCIVDENVIELDLAEVLDSESIHSGNVLVQLIHLGP